MANQYFIPYFRPVKDKSDAPVLNQYYIAADDANDYAVGTPMTLVAGANAINYINGAYVNQGIPQVTRATGGSGNPLIGFIVGFDVVPLSFTTNGSGINESGQVRLVKIADAPDQVWEGICLSALTPADANKNANVTIGTVNTTMRTDSSSINPTTATTAAFQLKLMGLAPIPGNEFGPNNVFRFKINNSSQANGVAGV